MRWVVLAIKRALDFQGRSRRKEYWAFWIALLVLDLISVLVAGIVVLEGEYHGLNLLYQLGQTVFWLSILFLPLVVPAISVTVRRLHDLGRSGWWVMGFLVVLIIAQLLTLLTGWPIYFPTVLAGHALMLIPGSKGENRFGEDPREISYWPDDDWTEERYA